MSLNNQLNKIDFSAGIRPEEIQENFEFLQEQISRERMSVGGAGISYGLNIEPVINEIDFYINISAGAVINDDGSETFIKATRIDINPPILYQCVETLRASTERTLTLKHKPYALNRRGFAQDAASLDPNVSGIEIKYVGSIASDDFIRVRSINENVLNIAGNNSRDLQVKYNYTAKRIDVLYLDNENNIKIIEGTTSTSPSHIMPLDAKFIIAYLDIYYDYVDGLDTTPRAAIKIRSDLRSLRNLYTDKDGVLYINNIPFNRLQIIHLEEPVDPDKNAVWLNVADNTLYCWRSTNEFTYKNKIEITTDYTNEEIGDLTYSTYMDFELGGTELSVYLNNNKLTLGTDYEEISKDLPTSNGNLTDESENKGNVFRILPSLKRDDGIEGTLVVGDIITYAIRYKDSDYTWVPINKESYLPVNNKRIYCTEYDEMKNEYYTDELIDGKPVAYFESSIANSLDGINGDGTTNLNVTHNYPYKYQYFLFHKTKDMDMRFTPDRNELSIMINQMLLHEDQFEEITIDDLVNNPTGKLPAEVIQAAKSVFGWDDNSLDVKNYQYSGSGIGFKLINPLDSGSKAETDPKNKQFGSIDLFVEATVTRRVCASPMNSKLERSATFVSEDTIQIKDFAAEDYFLTGVVSLNKYLYKYNEHQLELYLNGIKLVEGEHYIEEFGYYNSRTGAVVPPIDETDYDQDQSYFIRKKGMPCSRFKFVEPYPDENSSLTYRITTNIYSYDHISSIIDNLDTVLEVADNLDVRIEDIETKIEGINNTLENLGYNDKEDEIETDIIDIGRLPKEIQKNAIKSLEHINTSFILDDVNEDNVDLPYTVTVNDVFPDDYTTLVYHREGTNFFDSVDRFLVRGLHFDINENDSNSSTIVFANEFKTLIQKGDRVYITGLKVSTKRSLS